MNSLHLSEFRAIANNDLIRDNQQVSFANLEKGTGLCCNVSGEPRTFSQPEKRAAMSYNLRSQFLRLACSQLGRVPIPGDLAGIEAALEEKLLGKDVKVKGGMKPLDKRTIVQVLNLVDGMTKQALPLSAFRALVKASGFGNANSACTGFEEVLFANESRTKLTYGGRDSTRAPMSLKQKASESSLLRKHLLQQACKELDKMPGGEKDVKALLEGKLLGQNAQKSLDVRTIAEVLKLVDDMSATKKTVDQAGEKPPAPTDTSEARAQELREFFAAHDKMVAEAKNLPAASGKKTLSPLEQAEAEAAEKKSGQSAKTETKEVKKVEVAPVPGESKVVANTKPLTLKDIAKVALGTVKGVPDDKMCMGVANGVAVKFLAPGVEQQGEKKVSNRLYNIDKEVINSATENLKSALLDLAKGLDNKKLESVKTLLTTVPDKNGLELLSRQAVADAVGIIADELSDTVGWNLCLKDLAIVQHTGDVSLDAALLRTDTRSQKVHAWFDERRNEDLKFIQDNAGKSPKEIGKAKKQYHLAVYEKVKANPPDDETIALLDKEFAVVQGTDSKLDKVATRPCTKNPFVLLEPGDNENYSTSRAIDEAISRTGGPVCADIAADTTMNDGYMTWGGGQEECTTADQSSIVVAYKTAKNELVRGTHAGRDVLLYTKNDAEDRDLLAAGGYLINSEKMTTDMKPNANQEFQQIKLLYTSMPSLNTSANEDVGGGAAWMRFNLARIRGGGYNFTKEQNVNSENFVAKVFAEAGKLDGNAKYGIEGWTSDGKLKRSSEMLMIAEFLGDPAVFDPLAPNVDDQVAKLVNVMQKGDYKHLLEKAVANYKATLEDTMSKWMKLLVASGAKAYIGTQMGCGWFRNPPHIVAKTFAKLYIKMGADIPIFFPAWEKGEAGPKIWQNAFKEAWTNVQISEERDPATALGRLRERIGSIASSKKPADMKEFLLSNFFEPSFSPNTVAQFKAELKTQSRNGMAGMLKKALGDRSAPQPDNVLKLGSDLDSVVKEFVEGNNVKGEKLLLDMLKRLQAIESAGGKDAQRIEANQKFIDHFEQEIKSATKPKPTATKAAKDLPLSTFTAESCVTREKFVADLKALSGQKKIEDYLETFVRNLFKTTFEGWEAIEVKEGRLADALWEARGELVSEIIPRMRALAPSLSSKERLSEGVAKLSSMIVNDLKTWADANCNLDPAGKRALNKYLEGFQSLGKIMAVDALQGANVAADSVDDDVALERLSTVSFSGMDEGFASNPLDEGLKFISAIRAMATSGEPEATRIRNMDDFLMGFLDRMAAGGGLKPDHARDIASGLFLVDGAVQDVEDLIKDLANSTDGNFSADCVHRLSSFLNDCYGMIDFSDEGKSLFCARTIAVVKHLLAHPGDVESLRAFADGQTESGNKVAAMLEQLRAIASSEKSDVERRTDMKDYLLNDFFVKDFSSNTVAQFKAELKTQRRNNMASMLKAALVDSRPMARPAAQTKSLPKAQGPRKNDMASMLKKALGDSPESQPDNVLKLGSDLDSVVKEFVEGNNVKGEKLLLDMLKRLQSIESAGGKDTRKIEASQKVIDLFEQAIKAAQ